MKKKITFGRRLKVTFSRYGRVIIGSVILGIIIVMSLAAPLLTKEDGQTIIREEAFISPCKEHPFGTDLAGRDLFARTLYGARYSLLISFSVQIITIASGCLLGLLCGYYKWADKIIMRILEAMHSLPTILLVFVISSVLGKGVFNMIIALSFGGITQVTRQIRAQVLSLKQKEFIEREVSIGSGDFRTMIMHILPQCSSYLFVRLGSGLGGTIMSMTTLTYLGVGLPAEIPTWGGDISLGQMYIMAHPYLTFIPMAAISFTVFACSMLGDGLRDILDPKLNGGRK